MYIIEHQFQQLLFTILKKIVLLVGVEKKLFALYFERKNMMSKYSEDENDSSDDEFVILDERHPRCRVIYTHPDFHAIFQNSNTRDILMEKDKERSPEKLQSDEESHTIPISPTEQPKGESFVNGVSKDNDDPVPKNRFSSAQKFLQRLFKFEVFRKRSRKLKM